jgi:hypothetical protein
VHRRPGTTLGRGGPEDRVSFQPLRTHQGERSREQVERAPLDELPSVRTEDALHLLLGAELRCGCKREEGVAPKQVRLDRKPGRFPHPRRVDSPELMPQEVAQRREQTQSAAPVRFGHEPNLLGPARCSLPRLGADDSHGDIGFACREERKAEEHRP